MTRLIDADALLEVIKADRYTNAQDAIFFITNAPTVQQSEPFGYFKAEPFGWTDCAETDEGAIALYEAPTVQREGWVSVPIEPYIYEVVDADDTYYTKEKPTNKGFYFVKPLYVKLSNVIGMIQAAPTDKE